MVFKTCAEFTKTFCVGSVFCFVAASTVITAAFALCVRRGDCLQCLVCSELVAVKHVSRACMSYQYECFQ